MKKKISLLLALTMFLTGCNTAEKTEQKTAEITTTTTAETTVTTTTTATTTTVATTSHVEEISASDILLSPVENIGMNTAMPIESEEINGIESEESFSEKEHIRLVKEYAWDDSYVQKKLDIYDWEAYGQQRPSTAEELTFAYGLCLDFDDDGENESFVAIDLCCDAQWNDHLMLYYIDNNNIELIRDNIDKYPSFTRITAAGKEYWLISSYTSLHNHSMLISIGQNGIELIDQHVGVSVHDTYIGWLNKSVWQSYPAIFTVDGEYKRLAVERITEEQLIAHVNNAESLLSEIRKSGKIGRIYTAGHLSYWITDEKEEELLCYFNISDKNLTIQNVFNGLGQMHLPDTTNENAAYGIDLFGKVPDMSAIEYLTQIEKCEGFSDTLDMGADAVIADLDNDGSPELIIQICSMVTISDVFGIDENGAYRATVSKDSIITENAGDVSYVGEPPVGCIIDREPQYFARYWSGGSCGGEGGWARVILSDREIKTKPLAQYGMYRDGFAQVYEYSGFESEEEYNKYIEDFFSRHRSAPVVKFRLLDVEKSEYRALVLQQLEKYFTEYKSETSFASYLTAYTEKHGYPPHGVFIDDINGDGQDEMVMHINPYGYLYVLYIKDDKLKVLECDTMSEWGGTWYDKANNCIVNEYFHGHTEGSMGAYEYYVYDWNGEDYVMTMHLECEAGYFEREADGVTRTDNFIDGQAYLNGEEISSEEFEKLHTELTQVMTAENLFDVVTSGYFEIHKEAAEEQREIYNAYHSEKLYTPQMTYYEIVHHHRQDADSLPPKPQGINIAKLNYDDSGAVKTLDKDIENIAVKCLRSSESYTRTAEALKKSNGKYYIDEVELTAHTDENCEPSINITQSYSMDFDNNGKDEHFVILRYLDIEPEFIPYETDCCVFVSDSGNAELIIPKSIDMRMGIIQGDGLKHIIFEGGCNNTTSFFSIYSVKDCKPYKELDEWNGQSIKDGEIVLNTQLCRYCAAYDAEKQKYVFYSFYE